GSVELALAQWAAAVAADVAARVDRVADAGEHDPGPVEVHELQLPGRHLVQRGDLPGLAHASSLRTKARWSPVMYCQRISVASRTARAASACFSGVVLWRSTIW